MASFTTDFQKHMCAGLNGSRALPKTPQEPPTKPDVTLGITASSTLNLKPEKGYVGLLTGVREEAVGACGAHAERHSSSYQQPRFSQARFHKGLGFRVACARPV